VLREQRDFWLTYPYRVSGHVGRVFVDTSSAVHLTGVFWLRERGTSPGYAGPVLTKLYHWVIRKEQIDLTVSRKPPFFETNSLHLYRPPGTLA
jgi:hypothetical protein